MGRKFGNQLKSKFGLTNKPIRHIALGIVVIFISIACSNISDLDSKITPSPKTTALNIWWEQGFNLDEDEAIRSIVQDWQDQTGNQVQLSFYANSDLTSKAERAVKAGNFPDIVMNPLAERILYPRLAWDGKLADVADLIEPIKDQYPENILKGITYYNKKEDKRSYYGVPIYQSTMSIYYWQSLLASVGLSPRDIPQDWDGFWQFWQQAQTKLNEQNKDIYGLGLSLSGHESAEDTHYLFEQMLEAYSISLLDNAGKLNLDLEVRQGIIDCLSWYAQMYQQGYIPPDAVKWSNPDNNRSLLNQSSLMTPNGSLSIPATVRQDPDAYYNQLAISEFPHKLNGDPMCYLVFIRQAVIFENSPRKSLAKEFLGYFIQPEVTIEYLKATGSRHQPVQNSAWLDPYWQNTTDPYIATASKILTTRGTRLSYVVKHPAYSQVLAENVWGKAITKVTRDRLEPQQAADEAITRIKQIFREWQ